MTAVTFDYETWILRYPEFTAVSEPLAQEYFNEAGLYCTNDTCNTAFPAGVLGTFLNMLTAHIAWLNAPRDAQGNPATTGQPASPIVGRINTASEGSVSVGSENLYPPGSAQWYQQSKYGAAYWAATAPYRTMRYAAQPTYVPNGTFPALYPGAGFPFRRGF